MFEEWIERIWNIIILLVVGFGLCCLFFYEDGNWTLDKQVLKQKPKTEQVQPAPKNDYYNVRNTMRQSYYYSTFEPVKNSALTPDDAYDDGYSNGYEQGHEDGMRGHCYEYGYDSSTSYYNYYETRYKEGYRNGYEEGYSSGKMEFEEEQARKAEEEDEDYYW